MFEINRKLLMDRSVPDRIGTTLLRCDVPIQPLPKHEVLRKNFDFPEVSEGEIVRYFSQLSQMNFSIDQNFYPLGSCTMKYNPKFNDDIWFSLQLKLVRLVLLSTFNNSPFALK